MGLDTTEGNNDSKSSTQSARLITINETHCYASEDVPAPNNISPDELSEEEVPLPRGSTRQRRLTLREGKRKKRSFIEASVIYIWH